MGIEIYCSVCKNIEDRQSFSSKRKLLDLLRKYLREQNFKKELKYIHWLYREDQDDKDRVLTITEEEKLEAKELLVEKKLDGLFFWIRLDNESIITPYQATRFLKTFVQIKNCMEKNERFYNIGIISHSANKSHILNCY